jgi:UDP-N-acetylmuramoyl-tripeptide--D-alanyl-D-alanine ligase
MTIERHPSTAPAIALGDVAAATAGRLVGPGDVHIHGASVDSRQVVAGSLFVALRGERVDGHAFIADAARAGAAAAIVEREATDAPSLPQVVVADSLRALGDLAEWWRSRHAVRVVGVTGSTGKTLAKEVVADVLARNVPTLRSEGNLNSVIGLPMTVLHLDESHRAAVLEMGMYTTGEIARMAEIAVPEVGVVLAVHATHLERAGSIERIAEAKAELPRALPASGLAVLNADDSRVAAMADLTPASVLTFGLGTAADVRAEDVVSRGLAGTEFTLRAPWIVRRVRSGTAGRHLVAHALAAAAVGEWMGVPFDDVAAALEAGSRAAHRMAISTGPAGTTIVDDTYNASPVSVAAALAFLAETPMDRGGRRIAVLGDMLELGPDEERLHRDTGTVAADAADIVIAVGPRGAWIAEGAEAAGAARVLRAADAQEAAALLQHQVGPAAADVVLVKGSRGIGLDRTVDLVIGGGS